MRPALLALAALALASCGDDSTGPDWDGYAAYLTAEIRPADDPITAAELRDIHDDEFSCDDTTNEFYVARALDDGRDIADIAAPIYFLCDEDQAVAAARSILGVSGAADVRDAATTFERYAGG